MKVAFVGIGMMGKPMVLRLAGQGHEVAVYDTSQEAVTSVAGTPGVTAAPTLADAVRGAGAVITMLPDGKVVRKVAEAAMADIEDGAVLIDMSTAYPLETLALRDVLPKRIGLIAAPVSGGVARAEAGTLTLMTGGPDEDYAKVADVLGAMGEVWRTGALASGLAMKLMNNYLSAAGLAAMSEAVLVGQKFGLDPDLMADIFNVSTGMNNATKVKLKQHINSGKFASGFSMGLMAKDLTLGRQLAGHTGIQAEGLAAMQELYTKAAETLGPDADHTEVIKILQQD
ncbi:MAG: NAD(P)-dependent oxidoreductase [Pseudomonadota bacterium]